MCIIDWQTTPYIPSSTMADRLHIAETMTFPTTVEGITKFYDEWADTYDEVSLGVTTRCILSIGQSVTVLLLEFKLCYMLFNYIKKYFSL